MANSKISALPSASTPLAGTEVLPIVQGGITEQVSVANLTAGRSVDASTVVVSGNNTGITTGDPLNIVRFTDTDTTAAAGQPMGRIEWVSSDTGFEGVKGYIQVEATDGSPDGDMYFATQHNTGTGLTKRLKLTYDGDVTALTGNLIPATAAKGVNFTANTPAAGMTSQLLNWYEQGTFTPVAAGTTAAGVGTYSTQVGRYTRVGNLVTIKVALAWSAHTGTGNLIFTGLPFTVANDGADSSMAVGYLSNLALTALNVLTLIARVNTTTVGAYQYPTGGGAASLVPIDTAVTLIEFSGTYNV